MTVVGTPLKCAGMRAFVVALLMALAARTTCAETSAFPTSEKGWCMSWLNDAVDLTDSAELCWSTCEARHGDALVAIDWWPADTPGRGCWCQNACMCMDDGEIYVSEWACDPCLEDTTGAVTIIRDDVQLPAPCARDGLTANATGRISLMNAVLLVGFGSPALE